jgi:hypothetical protein
VLSFIPAADHCPSCVAGRSNLCDLGCSTLGRSGARRWHLPRQCSRTQRQDDVPAGYVQPLHGRAPHLGGEDRQGHSARARLFGRLLRHHRLRIGGIRRRNHLR